MNTLQAIELVKSTSPQQVSAEQLDSLRVLLEKTPSMIGVLGGEKAVRDFINRAEAAIASPVAVAVVDEAPVPSVQAAPRWSRKRWIELGVFSGLLLIVGTAFVGVLVSLLYTHDPSAPKRPALASGKAVAKTESAGSSEPVKGVSQQPQTSLSGNPPLVDEPENVWQGWTLTPTGPKNKRPHEKAAGWDLTDPASPRPIHRLISHGGLTFERNVDVPGDIGSLRIDCSQSRPSPGGKIELWVDGQPRGNAAVPAAGSPDPILLPVALKPGSRVSLKVAYTPQRAKEEIEWRSMTLSEERMEVLVASGEPDSTRPSLRLWLRADRGIKDAAGRAPSVAGFDNKIQAWEDQSSHRLHFTAGSPTALPTFVPAEPTVGKQPAIHFAGTYFRRAGGSIYDTSTSTSLCVFTVAGLARKQRSRNVVVLSTSSPSVGWGAGSYHDGRGRYGHEITFHSPKPLVSKMIPMGDYALIAAAKSSTRSSFIEVNGRARMYVEAGDSHGGDTMTIGGSHDSPGSYGGSIAELLVYNRALSNVELRQLGQYLQARYGIAGDY